MSEVEVSANTLDAKSARKDIEDFIQQINVDNFAQAEKTFKDMIGGRLGDMLDQQKAKIAGQMFSQTDAEIPEEEQSEDEEDFEEDFEEESEDEFEDEDDELEN